MAFDRTSTSDLAALKALVEGHADYVAGSTPSALEIANGPAESGATLMSPFTVARFVALVSAYPGEVDKPMSHGALLARLVASLDDETDLTEFLPVLEGHVGKDSPIVQAAKANVRPMTRAEEAFGAGVTITRPDWIAARNS